MMDSTQQILGIFEQVAAIPRATKHEADVSRWLQDWASGHGFKCDSDRAGNLVLRVPASPGLERASVVVLQGHMDMVCEKTPDSPHDFSKDPIHCVVDGEWLHADGTTLGADNGIAIALCLALAQDGKLRHPAMELLFTVEEEVGVLGASQLNPGLITGKTLINLDSEEEGEFTVGSAGGNTLDLWLSISPVAVSPGQELLTLRVDGLRGGHSGTDIHKHRANANKILARALDHLCQRVPFVLVDISGGTAHNAISRGSQATFACSREQLMICQERVRMFAAILGDEYATSDPGLNLGLARAGASRSHLAADLVGTDTILRLLSALPDGVVQMSASIAGLVETSSNLAVIAQTGGEVHVTSSQRSMTASCLEELTRRMETVAFLAGARSERSGVYPPWQPDLDSILLRKSVEAYESLFHEQPKVKAIHAGLECGVIGERCGGMDMLSLGPTIRDAHSPTERLYIPSVARLWDFLGTLLARLADYTGGIILPQ
jgi:dipeptidase D